MNDIMIMISAVRFTSRLVVYPRDELQERRREVLPDGVGEGRDVLAGVGVRSRRQPVGDGLEAEAVPAVAEAGSAFEEALVVVFGVDEGYVEALVVKELGEFEHCLDVALEWEWKAYGMSSYFLIIIIHITARECDCGVCDIDDFEEERTSDYRVGRVVYI